MERIELLVRCCECGRVRSGKTWEEATAHGDGTVVYSHGYCPPCFEKAMRDIDGDQAVIRLPMAG